METILVIDDDLQFRARLSRALRQRGFDAVEAGSSQEAELLLGDRVPARAVVDLRMPQEDGLAVVRALRSRFADCRVVVLTGYGSIATAVEALRRGAHFYLTKPADVERILAAFEDEAPAPLTLAKRVPSLDTVEWEHIQRVLQDCDGNVTRAAQLLGLHRRSLQRKLNRFGSSQ